MKFSISALKFFGYTWLTLGILFIGGGVIGIWMGGGFSAVQVLLSPFNVLNWIVMAVILGPGFGALIWAQKLQEKQATVVQPRPKF